MKRYLPYWLACLLVGTIGALHAQETEEVLHAVVDTDGKQKITMLAGSYFFKPNHVVVKAGIPVELSVRLELGIIPHTLVIGASDSGIAVDELLGTEPKVIVFTPKISGRYDFYCKNKFLFFKSHREEGMQGTLEVVE